MIREIPKRYEYECDRCMKKWSSEYEQACGLRLKGDSWGKSAFGDVAGGQVSFDFCSSCTAAFWEWKGTRK